MNRGVDRQEPTYEQTELNKENDQGKIPLGAVLYA
jgi:hypothetical protein